MDFCKELEFAKSVVDDCFSQFGIQLSDIDIHFNSRFTRKMGDATYYRQRNQARIRLSAKIWPLATEDERFETIVHEAAHIIAFAKYGSEISPHGREWKGVMRKLGLKPERCHYVDISSLKRGKQYGYYCTCSNKIRVGPTQHKRLVAGTHTYYTNCCKHRIELERVFQT